MQVDVFIIADFIRDREPSLMRLNLFACLRNLDLPDTSTSMRIRHARSLQI